MKIRNKVYFLFCSCFVISNYMHSQTLSPEIVTSNGGSSVYKDLIIDWTLGEIATETYFSPGRIVTQGFQQPVLKIASGIAFTNSSDPIVVNVYPNPVNDNLTVYFESKDDSKIIINVSDLFGKKIMMSVSNSQATNTEIDFSAYHAGIYLLTITKSTGEIIGTYRISKVQ